MISRIRGPVLEIGANHAVLDVGGLGYKVYLTADALHAMQAGQEASLWTHQAVREDALDLYGFPVRAERELFELLIGVSGIGPKTALNILSLVSSETLAGAVRTGSTAHLVKISGIGRKTAEKIVLELKDKLGGFAADDFGTSGAAAGMSSDLDAILALEALGYDADEARDALKKADAGELKGTSAKVKAALKLLK